MRRFTVSRLAAVAGSFVAGALCAAIYSERLKSANRKAEKAQVAEWENEGGNARGVSPPPTPQLGSQHETAWR